MQTVAIGVGSNIKDNALLRRRMKKLGIPYKFRRFFVLVNASDEVKVNALIEELFG
jgi:hypothetical protein